MAKGSKTLEKTFEFFVFLVEPIVFFLFFFFSFFPFFLDITTADIGENVNVLSGIEIGKSPPNIRFVDIGNGSINLIPNSTKIVNCAVEIEDFDGEIDIKNVSAKFFHSTSFDNDVDDNNKHYTNNSCYINESYGDGNTVLANCLFDVWYYANAGIWNCSVVVDDYSNYEVNGSNITQVSSLLAVGLPSIINYGAVNSTYVSDESITEVINFGNVIINLSLSGYAVSEGDNLSMNCTLGSLKNISIKYEKYNLTASTPGSLTLSQFEAAYINLTSSPVVKKFGLNYRQNDTENEAFNSTYWRIYVPVGVAGSCSGNIVFGAAQSSES